VKWKKYGKYEMKGRSSAMAEKSNWNENYKNDSLCIAK
jgi:hypothetical protein